MSASVDLRTLPPGPGRPRALVAARFLLRSPQFLSACRERYGDLFTVQPHAGRTVVIAADPGVAREVFAGDPDVFHAGAGNVVLRPLLGERSVLLLDGAEHLRGRRLLLAPFHGTRIRSHDEAAAAVVERHVARWPVGRTFAVHRSTRAITFEVILRAVFGLESGARVQQFTATLGEVLRATDQPLRLLALQFRRAEQGGPGNPWTRLRALMEPSDALIYEEIRARRAAIAADGDADRHDVLSSLLAARDEDGRPLTDVELRDQLITLLVAGHETTAIGLAWTLERLVRHPDVLARVLAEERDGRTAYLDATIRETLRMRPVIPGVVRQLTEARRLGGWEIPAGVHVAPSIYLIHHRADLYPEPDCFRPERFLTQQPRSHEWLPFGGGVRRCLGASFALHEMQLVLRTLLHHVELVPTQRRGEGMRRRIITFTPARGGRIRIARRPLAARA